MSARQGSRYPWPNETRSCFVLSFDVDAESGVYFRYPSRASRSVAAMEERRFGPRVGLPRVLRLLDRHGLRATFFVPGWTAQTYLQECVAIRDAGHEIGAHGMVHESVEELSAEDESAVLADALDALRSTLGVVPSGYRAPYFAMNFWTPALLARSGFMYDSSLWGYDIPYLLDTPSGHLVEVPVQSMLDDIPYYRHVPTASNDIAEPQQVLRTYRAEFDALHAEGGCFVLTQHPYVVGRASRLAALDELITYARSTSNVWFATCGDVAEWAMTSANSATPLVPRSSLDLSPAVIPRGISVP